LSASEAFQLLILFMVLWLVSCVTDFLIFHVALFLLTTHVVIAYLECINIALRNKYI